MPDSVPSEVSPAENRAAETMLSSSRGKAAYLQRERHHQGLCQLLTGLTDALIEVRVELQLTGEWRV